MKKLLVILVVIASLMVVGCDLAPVSEALSKTSEALTVAEENLWPVAKSSWDAYSERHPEFRTLEFPDGIVTVEVPAIKPKWYHKKPYPKPTPRPTPKPTPKPLPEPGSFADSENSYLFDDIWCEPSELVNNAYEAVYVDIVDVHVDTMDERVDETAECPGSEDGEGWDYYGEIPDSYF